MADLETKIEFKQLCDTLEGIAKAHEVKKKDQILQMFIDDCRNIGNKLKAEYPESVCTMLINAIANAIVLYREISHNLM